MTKHDRAKRCLELVQEINACYVAALDMVATMVDRLNQVREHCHEVTGEAVMEHLLTDEALQQFVGKAVEHDK